MWTRSTLFFIYIQTFHQLGLLPFFAVYLYYEKGIQYDDFYSRLIEWSALNKDTLCGKLFAEFTEKLSGVSEGTGSRTYMNERYGNIVWPLEEGAFLDILPHSDLFYQEIKTFFTEFDIETSIFQNLLAYQTGMIKRPGKHKLDISLDYDFHNYFESIYVHNHSKLESAKNILHLQDNKCAKTWKEFATENVWYGRNDSRTIFRDVTVEYLAI
jgi:hypothetical protein